MSNVTFNRDKAGNSYANFKFTFNLPDEDGKMSKNKRAYLTAGKDARNPKFNVALTTGELAELLEMAEADGSTHVNFAIPITRRKDNTPYTQLGKLIEKGKIGCDKLVTRLEKSFR